MKINCFIREFNNLIDFLTLFTNKDYNNSKKADYTLINLIWLAVDKILKITLH